MAEVNQRKAHRLYACIDESGGFYVNPVAPGSRSLMNVPFFVQSPDLEPLFLEQSQREGLIGLKGHRSIGGMRASIYNAVPESSVDVLVEFMRDFQRIHG